MDRINDIHDVQDGAVRDEAVRTLYAEGSVWTDPLTTARGIESIVANYRSLPTVAAAAQVQVLHATYVVNDGKDAILRYSLIIPCYLALMV